MVDKRISDLTAATRLKTGAWLELQDSTIRGSAKITGDDLSAGLPFDTQSQILGRTAANTMEVEANNLAARLHLCPDEINAPLAGWQIGRYASGNSNYGYLTVGSAAVFNDIIYEFSWINVTGIAVIKKVMLNFAVGASTNTASGTANFRMYRAFGIGPVLDTSNVGSPGAQGGSAAGRGAPAGSGGIKGNQLPSQARTNAGFGKASRGGGATNANTSFTDPNPIGLLEAGFVAGAGKNIFMNSPIFDYRTADHPLILTPGTGFEIWLQIPTTSSGSSSTIHMFASVQWDEWTLGLPGVNYG